MVPGLDRLPWCNFIVFHFRSDMPAATNNGKPWLTLMADLLGVWGWLLPPMSEEEVSAPKRGPGNMEAVTGLPDFGQEAGISQELVAEIEKWQIWGEDSYDDDNGASFDSEAFDKKGRELALRLKAEIGDRYNIRLFLDNEGKYVVV